MKKYAFFLKDFRHPFTTKANSKKEALVIFEDHTSGVTSGKDRFKAAIIKENRGGKRVGSGQPKKTPTKTISNRVPEIHYEKLKTTISKLIADYLK